MTNKVAKWATLAGMFRYFETFSVLYFLPSFFMKVYPAYKVQYGLYNSLIIASLGFCSTLLGGLISDRFEKRNRLTKALVCMIGSGLAIPAIAACTLTTGSFYISLAAMAIKYLVSECWMSPAITMMQSTVEAKK